MISGFYHLLFYVTYRLRMWVRRYLYLEGVTIIQTIYLYNVYLEYQEKSNYFVVSCCFIFFKML